MRSKAYRVVFHVFFWLGIAGVMLLLNRQLLGAPALLPRVGLALVMQALAVYINLLVLLPRFFFTRNYAAYFALLGLLIGAFTWLRAGIEGAWMGSAPGLVTAGSFYHYFGVALLYLIMIAITSSFSFLEHVYRMRELSEKLRSGKLEAELKLLRAQVNPHFLFNALNNIYSLSYLGAPNAPAMILKLSEMMRYLLLETDKETVPLRAELQYMEDYIALQQLKTERPRSIAFELKAAEGTENRTLAPLLFIPLLENCFKHGSLDEEPGAYLKIKVEVEKNSVQLLTENTVSNRSKPQREQSGTGLNNLRNRLALLYPGRHELTTQLKDGVFKTQLHISGL